MEICTSLSGQSFLGPCLYLSAAQVLRLLLAVVLTQQLLSIPFHFVMLDFLLPRALSARSSSAACQLQQEKAPWTDGWWADNGGRRGCFFLSDFIPLHRSFFCLPWWRCWRSVFRGVCAWCHRDRWSMRRRAGAVPRLLGRRWPSSGPACSWPCTWWELPHLMAQSNMVS